MALIERVRLPPAAQVLERRSTVSGRAYKDDPTILGFDLLNELRCSSYEARGGGGEAGVGGRAGAGTAAPSHLWGARLAGNRHAAAAEASTRRPARRSLRAHLQFLCPAPPAPCRCGSAPTW